MTDRSGNDGLALPLWIADQARNDVGVVAGGCSAWHVLALWIPAYAGMTAWHCPSGLRIKSCIMGRPARHSRVGGNPHDGSPGPSFPRKRAVHRDENDKAFTPFG